MEKKTRTADAGEASGSDGGGLVNRLPEALLVEVLGLLELDDACSAAASCRALHAAGAAAISAITTLDLSEFAPSNAILSGILAGNSSIRCLTINCNRLDDSAAAAIAKHSLRELSLLKCSFSKSFFVAIGEKCPNLRSLKLEMAVTPDALDSHHDGFNCTFVAPIFAGCSYLEILWMKFPLLDPRTADIMLTFIPSTIKELLLQPVSQSWARALFLTPVHASLKLWNQYC